MSKSVQKIKVKNFRALKDVEIEVNDLVILLGEQASGKSTLGKLIYFFRSLRQVFLKQILHATTYNIDEESDFSITFKKEIQRKFGNYFGWPENSFNITFHFDHKNRISITKHNTSPPDVKFTPNTFSDLFSTQNVQKFIDYTKEMKSVVPVSDLYCLEQLSTNSSFIDFIENSFEDNSSPLYFPAGRNIAVTYWKQFDYMFREGLTRTETDYGLIGLGYEDSKWKPMYDWYLMEQFIQHTEEMKKRYKVLFANSPPDYAEGALGLIQNLTQKILKGYYYPVNATDLYGYERTKEGKSIIDRLGTFDLANASSGQQEAIRILQDAFLVVLDNTKAFRVIEEPEAHLYPMAQKHLIEVLATVLNHTDSQIIITTHSPYILSIANNLLFATRVAKNNPSASDEIAEVIPKLSWLDPEKTNVYFLKDGVCESVFDDALGMIDQNRLDEISEQLGADFDRLYDIHARSFSWTEMNN